MKTRFVKTTLSLSLLLMATAPTAAFAGTNCDTNVSVPSNQVAIKDINSCFLKGNSSDCLKKQDCLNLESYFKFDGGKPQFVPNNNCQLKDDNNCNKNNGSNGNCGNEQNKPSGDSNGSQKPPQKPDNSKPPVDNTVPEKPDNNGGNNNTGNNGGNDSNIGNIGSYEKQVADLVNKERKAAGLAPLTFNSKLANVAEAKAEDMRDKNYFSHTSPTYGSPFDMMKQFGIKYSSAGENIAKGQKSPESVMSGWMNSPGHKANIMSTNYDQIGVGYTTDSKGNTYWVQMFIK